MIYAPTRKYKRPFGEVNLDLKAREHRSLEDQKRRNSGPPQLQNLHTLQTMQGKEQEPSWDAARLRASVDIDPTKDSNLQRKSLSEHQREWIKAAACWSADCIVSKRDQQAGTNKWWLRSHNTLWWSFLSSADAYQEIWIRSYSSNPWFEQLHVQSLATRQMNSGVLLHKGLLSFMSKMYTRW